MLTSTHVESSQDHHLCPPLSFNLIKTLNLLICHPQLQDMLKFAMPFGCRGASVTPRYYAEMPWLPGPQMQQMQPDFQGRFCCWDLGAVDLPGLFLLDHHKKKCWAWPIRRSWADVSSSFCRDQNASGIWSFVGWRFPALLICIHLGSFGYGSKLGTSDNWMVNTI